ncbi:unnamed protein product [Arctia plantaginis]|uniref:HTH psq-type domain-containing protein n=1 Tax=Arctia plantaginis TaxID=874455 RepID=A0A8S1AQG5_ARCPL|nr:unnamed protein product [Arctia plantaginis]
MASRQLIQIVIVRLRRKKTVFLKFRQDNVVSALEAVQKDMSKKLAAKTYQVPRTTLIYRLQNPEHKARPGPATLLTKAEENDLESWINNCAIKGFPKRKDDAINSNVNEIDFRKCLGKSTDHEKSSAQCKTREKLLTKEEFIRLIGEHKVAAGEEYTNIRG